MTTVPPEEIEPNADFSETDQRQNYELDGKWGNSIPMVARGLVVDVVYQSGAQHRDHANNIDWSKVKSFKLSLPHKDGGIVEDGDRVEPKRKKITLKVNPVGKPDNAKKYNHYFKRVPWKFIDIYRLLELFGVTDQAIGHAIKKLLVPGLRGNKPTKQDVIEARDTLNRRIEMWEEDDAVASDDDMF